MLFYETLFSKKLEMSFLNNLIDKTEKLGAFKEFEVAVCRLSWKLSK